MVIIRRTTFAAPRLPFRTRAGGANSERRFDVAVFPTFRAGVENLAPIGLFALGRASRDFHGTESRGDCRSEPRKGLAGQAHKDVIIGQLGHVLGGQLRGGGSRGNNRANGFLRHMCDSVGCINGDLNLKQLLRPRGVNS